MTHPAEMKMEAILVAERLGMRAASRQFGLSTATVKKWVDEAKGPVEPFVGGVSLAVVEAEVVNGNEQVEGLPEGTTAAYIDPENVTRIRGIAHLYADRKRAELRVELADAAIEMAKNLRAATDGRDAQGWAKALGDVVDRLRLESGQVTDLRGRIDLRGSLDQQQMAAVAGGQLAPDLTVPIEASSIEVVDDD